VAPLIALALRAPAMVGLDDRSEINSATFVFVALSIACGLAAVAMFRIGDSLGGILSRGELWLISIASGAASSTSAVLCFMVNRLDAIPRSTPLIYFLVMMVGLAGGRILVGLGAANRDVRGEPHSGQMRRIILVGVDRFSSMAIRLADSQSPRTIQFAAALDPRRRLVGRSVNGVPIVGAPADLRPVIEEYAVHGVEVDEVWVADALFASEAESMAAMADTCDKLSVAMASVSSALNLAPSCDSKSTASGAIAAKFFVSGYFRAKRCADVAAAAVLLCALAPIALMVAGVVAFDVGAPIFFWQQRIGRHGRKFLLYKFRTYRAPFDRQGRARSAAERLSKVGAAVRKTRLDEVPQLLNVLRGDMSLIGPRPLLPVDQPADPQTRLMVRPGVTGWAQVNGGVLLTPEEKDALDSWYIRHASPRLDLEIAWRTLVYFIQGERKGAAALEAAARWRSEAPRERGTPAFS